MDELDAVRGLRSPEGPSATTIAAHRSALAHEIDEAAATRSGPAGVTRRRRWLLVAVCVVVAAVASTGALIALAGPEHSGVTTPVASAPTSTTPETAPRPAYACGERLPIELGRLDGFDGPAPGPGDHSTSPAADDQLVFHWSSPTGSIEARWPMDADAGIVITEPGPTGSGSTSIFPPQDPNGLFLHRTVLAVGPEAPLSCRLVQIDVRDTDGERAQATTTLLRRTLVPTPPLVVDSQERDDVPAVTPCATPPGTESTPNRGGPVTRDAHPTPEQALQDFLATEPTLAQHSYIEWRTPDGNVLFAQPRHDGNGYITIIRVASTPDNRWSVVSFEASGC